MADFYTNDDGDHGRGANHPTIPYGPMTDSKFDAAFVEALKEGLQQPLFDRLLNDEEDFIARTTQYARHIARISQMINLTSITSPRDMALKHVLDSATALTVGEWPSGCRVVDVGTGGGFPGAVLNIARPDMRITFVDSVRKKLVAVRSVCEGIGVRAAYEHGRAEQLGQDRHHRESFDVSIARALARLSVASELCLPLTKVGGWFIAMKGPDGFDELNEAKKAIETLGGKVEVVEQLSLPAEVGDRVLIGIRKERETPLRYPRRPGTPLKQPL